jgi:amino acid transporter
MSPSPDTKLVRVIGRWSLTALMVNAIIGSGIFGLPSIVTHSIGRLGPWAYLVAAGGNRARGSVLCRGEFAVF